VNYKDSAVKWSWFIKGGNREVDNVRLAYPKESGHKVDAGL